jgi:hypothetical protein
MATIITQRCMDRFAMVCWQTQLHLSNLGYQLNSEVPTLGCSRRDGFGG